MLNSGLLQQRILFIPPLVSFLRTMGVRGPVGGEY
jgi:hypothetical protein